jgi:hypothetical protein
MSELKVKRKGYWRGPYDYVRGGKKIHIEKHWVPETTFMTKDRGEPGRTPEEDRWFDPKRHTGWQKTQEPTVRRRNVLEATDKDKSIHDRYIQAGRMIQELSNVTTDEDTKEEAKADAEYFFKKAKETP